MKKTPQFAAKLPIFLYKNMKVVGNKLTKFKRDFKSTMKGVRSITLKK